MPLNLVCLCIFTHPKFIELIDQRIIKHFILLESQKPWPLEVFSPHFKNILLQNIPLNIPMRNIFKTVYIGPLPSHRFTGNIADADSSKRRLVIRLICDNTSQWTAVVDLVCVLVDISVKPMHLAHLIMWSWWPRWQLTADSWAHVLQCHCCVDQLCSP